MSASLTNGAEAATRRDVQGSSDRKQLLSQAARCAAMQRLQLAFPSCQPPPIPSSFAVSLR